MSRNLLKIKDSRVWCVLMVQKSRYKRFVTKICNTILFQNTINRRHLKYDWWRGLLSPFLRPTSPQMSLVKSGLTLKQLMFNPCLKSVHISKFYSRLKRHCFGDITFCVGCSNCQHLKRVELFDCQLITKAESYQAHLSSACTYSWLYLLLWAVISRFFGFSLLILCCQLFNKCLKFTCHVVTAYVRYF